MNYESRPNTFTEKFDIYQTFRNDRNERIAMKMERNFATQAEADKRVAALQHERQVSIERQQKAKRQHVR